MLLTVNNARETQSTHSVLDDSRGLWPVCLTPLIIIVVVFSVTLQAQARPDLEGSKIKTRGLSNSWMDFVPMTVRSVQDSIMMRNPLQTCQNDSSQPLAVTGSKYLPTSQPV